MRSKHWKNYSIKFILFTLFLTLFGAILALWYVLTLNVLLTRAFITALFWGVFFLWFSHENYKKRGWEKRYISLDYKIVRKDIENILKENRINYKLIPQHILSHDIHSFLLYEKNFKINLKKYGFRFRGHKYTVVSIGPIKDNNIQEIREIENRINKRTSSRKKTKGVARSEQVGVYR
ncbi:MAG: hypothetical protein JSW00_04440 [Thermoplasmata archaeon]|nr:MAG: hypothetical protein JSW00_04440 [Thermoplasmata archaeon]